MFSSRTDHIANAAKLLTASAAFVASPGLKSGTSVYDAGKKLFKSPPPGLLFTADAITHFAIQTLQGFARDLPNDAPILFEQMVIATLPDSTAIVAQQMNAAKVANYMRSQLNDPDHLRAPMPEFFVAIVTPVFEKLFADTSFAADLTPAVYAQLLDETAEISSDVKDLKSMMQGLIAGKISLDDMKVLAANFGEHDITDQPSLERFLKLKAEEYLAFKSEIDTIDDGLKRLSNLKAAAQDAIARIDLDEVEALLSLVQEVELEEAEKTAKLRAQNALLRGNVELAYRLLSVATDSFAAVDSLEPARRRISAKHSNFKMLYEHGLRYGGQAISSAIDFIQPILTPELLRVDPILWAKGQNSLGAALQEQGNQTNGPASSNLLDQAISSFRAALKTLETTTDPYLAAEIQNNLGMALGYKGNRADAHQGRQFFIEAMEAFYAAIDYRTFEEYPIEWVVTLNNLAATSAELGTRMCKEDGLKMMTFAISAYRDVLNFQKLMANSVECAQTQNNICIALTNQAKLTEGAEKAQNLKDAIDASNEALRVFNRTEYPIDWAMTQINLGNALLIQGIYSTTDTSSLNAAVSAYRSAQEIYNRTSYTALWANAHENIAVALANLGLQSRPFGSKKLLSEALEHVNETLEVYDPEHMSYFHAKATRLREEILAEIDALPNPKT